MGHRLVEVTCSSCAKPFMVRDTTNSFCIRGGYAQSCRPCTALASAERHELAARKLRGRLLRLRAQRDRAVAMQLPKPADDASRSEVPMLSARFKL